MPPRVGLRSRREPDAQPQSDADSIATPSRKRRRLNGNEPTAAVADPPRTRRDESVASNDSNTTLPNADDEDPVERQNRIIAALLVPNYTPNAAIDYANDLQARKNQGHNIAAFAKIAARDWCFFVQETRILIGRADSSIRPQPPSSEANIPGHPQSEAQSVSNWGVHIDLGPERQVSRVHAEIFFDSADQGWYIIVNSRNGLKLDDVHIAKGQTELLHSGICISIMGTQMLFLLANQEDHFHPMLFRQANGEEAGESGDDGNPPPRSNHNIPPSGPTPKREQYDPFPPSSHPRNRENKHQSSQAYYNQMTSTPGRPPPGTPLAFQQGTGPRSSKGSPATFSRGVMIDSTDEVDYSHDQAKDMKPPYSYAQLIGQAILSNDEEMLTLANIYDYIKSRYAFFRFTNGGWQNSIRHNLSLNKSFEKVARRTDEPGKGMKWKIADSEREEFIRKQLLNPRKGGGIAIGFRPDGSGPSSPALGNPSQATERLVGALDRGHQVTHMKSPPRSATPPLSSVPAPNESYTPDRGSRPFGALKQSPNVREMNHFVTPAKRLVYGGNDGRHPPYIKTEEPRPHLESSPNMDPVKPMAQGLGLTGLKSEAANSPPTLYSDAATSNIAGNHDASRMNNALVTPLVTRHAPRLAPPSTAQIPSQYMNFSSPAPFWKFVDLPSTPAKFPVDFSPTKMHHDDKDEDDAQPSSPPMLPDEDRSAEPEDQDASDDKPGDEEDIGPESPSRTVSRPVSRRDLGCSQRSRSNSNVNALGTPGLGGMVRGASLNSFEDQDEPEEESYDLSKGFQKIGSFHHSMAQAHGVVGRSAI
ncbi:transcription factor [Didymella glomerata]|uniref:Transcription factor n=1 Tax=Didymella glomerata TaxID=749621 RepID=A0A9W9C207_9PLEO|nr:transcription factor [Didymella glomerata]